MLKRLDAKQVEQFEKDGFLAFDPALAEPDVEKIRSTLMALHRKNIGFREGALFDAMGPDDGTGPKRFPQILHPRSFAPDLMKTEFYRTAQSLAEQLLGKDVRFKADISLMKPAWIGEATPWHQDEAFQDPKFEYHEISFWLALQPTDEANGCMAYIPGSHKEEVLPHHPPGGDWRIHALECAGKLDTRAAVSCPLPTGGCVIHTQRTVHGAGPNVSSRDRLAYVLIFDLVPTPAPIPRHFPWRDQQQTARAQRELAWRRRGGLVIHLWRQRSRLRVTDLHTFLFDTRRAIKAALRTWMAGGRVKPRVRVR